MIFFNWIPGFRTSCPDSNRLAAFVDRTLNEADRSAVRKHIARCDSCFETVTQLSVLQEQPPAELPRWIANDAKSLVNRPMFPLRPASLKLAGSLAAVVLLVVVGIAFWAPGRFRIPESQRSVRGADSQVIQVTLSRPQAGATLDPAELEFSWTEIPDAIRYRIQITDLEGNLLWEAQQSSQTSVRAPESAIPEGNYFASIQVILRDGRVVRSEFVRFGVRRPNAP